MLYDTVVDEINVVRSEKGLVPLRMTYTTPLQDLGFDSLMYTVLVTRLETKLECDAFRRLDGDALPVTVGDLVSLFQAPQNTAEHRRTAAA